MSTSRSLFLRLPPYFGYARHHPHDVSIPFTCAYGASIIRKSGREAAILDAWANNWSREKILTFVGDYRPDVIFFDSSTGVIPILREFSREIKKSLTVKTVIFGAVPTFSPDVVFKGDLLFDVGIVEECEQTVVHLLDALENNQPSDEIPGLVYWDKEKSKMVKTGQRPLLENLDLLPFIDYSLFNLKLYRKFSFPIPTFRPARWGYVLATRGCPYQCSFCGHDHRQSYGKNIRRSSPKRVASEFETLVLKHKVNAISIEDDCFTLDRNYVLEICDEIEKRNLDVKWVVQTRADLLDKPLMHRMKQAGCVGLSLGLESGSDRVLKVLKKDITRAQSEQIVREAAEEGFMLRLLFMVGNPTETREEMDETLDLALKAEAITIQVYFCTPYPGTSFFGQTKDDLNHLESYSSYDAIHRNMSRISDHELQEIRNRFYRKYYFSWRYLKLFFRQRLPYLAAQVSNDIPFILRSLWYMARPPSVSQKRFLSQ